MTGFLLREDLVGRLFFPTKADSPTPPGGIDRFVEVDGARLHVREHAVGAERGVVFLCHGNGETVAAWDQAGAAFATRGFSLVVWDYRGYGRSTGTSTLEALLTDASAVRASIAEPRVVLFGRSLGSRPAWELAAAGAGSALIVDSGFTDVDAFVRRRGLEPSSLEPSERARIDPLPRVASTTLPVLVLHGEDDAAIDVSETEAIARTLPSATIVRLPGVGHNDLYTHRGYEQALGAFLDRVA